MPQLLPVTPIDFDKLADDIVTSFFKTGKPLEKLSAEVAIKESLNPEEVRRLVEKSNTGAVISMLKTSSDKKVEFDLADPDKVLEVTHGANNGVVKTACDTAYTIQDTSRSFEIPDTRSVTYDLKSFLDTKLFEKKAEKNTEKEDEEKLKNYYRLQKEKHDLVYTKTNLEKKAQESIDFILSDLSKQSSVSFEKFANDMTKLHKSKFQKVRNILTKFAESLDTTIPPYSINTADVVDDTTKIATSFDELIKTSEELVYINNTLMDTEKRISTFFADSFKNWNR